MALIECEDCNAMISSRAPACPYCGGPVQTSKIPPQAIAGANPLLMPSTPTAAVVAPAALHDDRPIGKYVDPNQKPRWVHALGLIAVAVIAGTAMASWKYGLTSAQGLPLIVATGVGMSLIPLVIALIVLAFGKRSGAWTVFFLIAGGLAWSSWEAGDRRLASGRAAKVEFDKLKADGARLRAGGQLEGDLPPIPQTRRYSDAELLRIVRQTYVATNNDLTRELKRIAAAEDTHSVDEILRAETLASSEGLRHARASIVEYRRLQTQREAAMRKFGSDVDARVTPLSEGRAELQASWEKKRAVRDRKLESLAKAQRDAIMAIDQVVRLAEAHEGALQVQDGRLMFPDDESLAEFNRRQRVLADAAIEVQRQLVRYDEDRATIHEHLSAVQQ